MYEQYTHYVPGDSPRLKHFVVDLVTGYCNLCDAVIAPSESVARLLVRRGVKVPIEVIPTGVDAKAFASGDGSAFRARIQIASDAFVVGHTGRLAPEKNLGFLADAVVRFLLSNDRAHFLVAGDGQSKEGIQRKFVQYGLGSRIHLAGILNQKELAGAYRAMDVFAFASQTETQGMVLTEAMAAGVPVVAVDASGVREVVRDRVNGRLLPKEDLEEFASALRWIASLNPQMKKRLKAGIAETISEFAMPHTAKRVLTLYQDLIKTGPAKKESQESHWASSRRLLEEEFKILRNIVHAAGDAVLPLSKAPGG
jgi:glycosyltransferase involved in cell wall biosynthesis